MGFARDCATVALSLAVALCCGCVRLPAGLSVGDRALAGMVSTTLEPAVVEPGDLRWRDVADTRYEEGFVAPDFYAATGRRARFEWLPAGDALCGRLSVHRLKPNFAYQVKLVGAVPVRASSGFPPGSAEWGSAALGTSGRWCRADRRTNVAREQVAAMLEHRTAVLGYLLFDFLVTDAEGNADKPLRLDSSYHVLWRADQRRRNRRDSPEYKHRIVRRGYGYGGAAPEAGGEVGVFAEREPPHPGHGQVRLPPGTYSVRINLTEESFHARQKGPAAGGGHWAQVLEAPIEFTITR